MNKFEPGTFSDIANTLAIMSVATLFLLPWLWEKLIASFAYKVGAVITLLFPLFLVSSSIAAFLMGDPNVSRILLVAAAITEPVCITALAILGFVVLREEHGASRRGGNKDSGR